MRTLPHVLVAAFLLLFTGSAARADLVLSGGGAWPSGGGGPRPVGALGWRGALASDWSSEIRGSRAGTACSLRHTGRPWRIGAFSLQPAGAAGVDLNHTGQGALIRVAGYHIETGIAMPMPEGTALELSARWVVRGDGGPRGPDAFASRYAEVTLGFVFRLE